MLDRLIDEIKGRHRYIFRRSLPLYTVLGWHHQGPYSAVKGSCLLHRSFLLLCVLLSCLCIAVSLCFALILL